MPTIIAFVNSKSGGQYGIKVLERLKKHLPADHIFDLSQGGPASGLNKFKGSKFCVLACGGDGTAGWVLTEIEKLGFPPEMVPPVAILPIGTGNDLARTLKWGGGYSGGSLSSIFRQLDKACVVFMDKWRITRDGTDDVMYMNNYVSFGSDADVALKFHEARKAHPEKFTGQMGNKMYYVRVALADISPKPLVGDVAVEIDGREVELSPKIRCVVVTNLPSYSGGGDLWGPHKSSHERRGFSSPKIDDGLLEVVGIRGPIQIAAIHANVSRAKKLGQGKQIRITLRKDIPVQVDGEPWAQVPTVFTIQHSGKSVMLANSPPNFHPTPTPPTPGAPLASPSTPSISLSPPPSPSQSPYLPLPFTPPSASAPSSPVFTDPSARTLQRSRSASSPVTSSSKPSSPQLSYGPVDRDKRKKNRFYCDACGLEFILPHMLENHANKGLCSGAASSSSSKKSGEWRSQSADFRLVSPAPEDGAGAASPAAESDDESGEEHGGAADHADEAAKKSSEAKEMNSTDMNSTETTAGEEMRVQSV